MLKIEPDINKPINAAHNFSQYLITYLRSLESDFVVVFHGSGWVS
jgi:hypothetical protein